MARGKTSNQLRRRSRAVGENGPDTSKLIKSIPFFASLSDDLHRSLLKSPRFEEYQSGERIIERDGEDKDVFFLVVGCVHVLSFSPSGRVVSYGTLDAGDFFLLIGRTT